MPLSSRQLTKFSVGRAQRQGWESFELERHRPRVLLKSPWRHLGAVPAALGPPGVARTKFVRWLELVCLSRQLLELVCEGFHPPRTPRHVRLNGALNSRRLHLYLLLFHGRQHQLVFAPGARTGAQLWRGESRTPRAFVVLVPPPAQSPRTACRAFFLSAAQPRRPSPVSSIVNENISCVTWT